MVEFKRRDSDKRLVTFDFTVNIPTIVTVLILAGTIIGWVKKQYESLDIFISQHNIMWAEYVKAHPEAGYYIRQGK